MACQDLQEDLKRLKAHLAVESINVYGGPPPPVLPVVSDGPGEKGDSGGGAGGSDETGDGKKVVEPKSKEEQMKELVEQHKQTIRAFWQHTATLILAQPSVVFCTFLCIPKSYKKNIGGAKPD